MGFKAGKCSTESNKKQTELREKEQQKWKITKKWRHDKKKKKKKKKKGGGKQSIYKNICS